MILIVKIAFLVAMVWAGVWVVRQCLFGWKSIGAWEVKANLYTPSDHYDGTYFINPEPTTLMLPETDYWELTKAYFLNGYATKPAQVIVYQKPDLDQWMSNHTEISMIWMGHSSYALNIYGYICIVDPVLEGYAAPLPFLNSGFEGTDVFRVQDFSRVDAVVFTHDHYDHLDYASVLGLKEKAHVFISPPGVEHHLVYWGVLPEKIAVLDWWQVKSLRAEVQIQALPARHFSGRFVWRNQSLWNAYVLNINGFKLVLGGDSGYGKHFKQIHDTIGNVDVAILECGQYHPYWKYIHMLPEEVPLAAQDLGASVLIPVHWGKFALALHAWDEPMARLAKAMESQTAIQLQVPKLGAIHVLKPN